MNEPLPRIRRLPEAVAARIAAGEVVERPAAAVKELIENALDAGAGRIDVTIEQGGRRLLEVADDGCGMTPAEARLALERHATSKIRTVDDLLAIETYGFRGEALASIAAVSRLTLVTRVPEAVAGVRIDVEGGVVRAERPAGAPAGTTVTVRDLFFNLPARRQFLRSAATEAAQVVDVVARLALARPDVAVTLTVDGRLAVAGRRDADLAERLDALLGPEAPPLVEVRAEEGGLAVTGRLSPPGVSRPGASSLYLFVNGRPVRDRSILHATLQGSRHAHEPGRYPMGALFVVVPPHMVDVNVHPQKAEVRFRDPAAVHGLVARAVESALVAAGALPAAVRAEPAGTVPPSDGRAGRVQAALDAFLDVRSYDPTGADRAAEPAEAFGATPARAAATPAHGSRFAGLRYIGQLRASYLLCEGREGLVVVDQHAAHERLRFERLRRALAEGRPRAVRLLVPRAVTLRADRAALVVERAGALADVGLEVEPFGPIGTLRVTAVPIGLETLDPGPLLESVAEDLEGLSPARSLEDARDHLLATVACHGAVTFRQALDPLEAGALLADLDRYEVTGACPHGRPVSRLIGFAELERLFDRR
ncbi:MAG TPA: DNA mismatch repair endonuclease MutL [Thermodesulfobacteriota bacterium]